MEPPARRPGLSGSGRRRTALGLAALAAVPVVLVSACGNGERSQASDTRPEPNASTEGVRSVYPMPVAGSPTQGPVQAPRQGGDQSPGTGVP